MKSSNKIEMLFLRVSRAGVCLLVLLLACTTHASVDRGKERTAHHDVGSYAVDIALGQRWKVLANPRNGFVVFDYADLPPIKGEFARLGLFRFVVPEAARGADKTEVGAEYAIKDVAGIQKGLFGTLYPLRLASRRPRKTKGGIYYDYRESTEIEAGGNRSTKFVRAAIYYPSTYEQDGALFLLVGLQQFTGPTLVPEALEKIPDILAGVTVTKSRR